MPSLPSALSRRDSSASIAADAERACERSNGLGSTSARSAKTSFRSSSERPSRTCSTGSASQDPDGGDPPVGRAEDRPVGPTRTRLLGRRARSAPGAPGSRATGRRAAGRATRSGRARPAGRARLRAPIREPDARRAAPARPTPPARDLGRRPPTGPVRPPSAIGLPYTGSADDAGAAPIPAGRSSSTPSMKSTTARVDSSRKRTNTRSVPVLARRRASSAGDRRKHDRALRLEQRCAVEPGPDEQHQLEQEERADLADVLDRLEQPARRAPPGPPRWPGRSSGRGPWRPARGRSARSGRAPRARRARDRRAGGRPTRPGRPHRWRPSASRGPSRAPAPRRAGRAPTTLPGRGRARRSRPQG